MKVFLMFLIFCFYRTLLSGQVNLVPNPSFEQLDHCPFTFDDIDAAAGWLNFGNSPDYFNSCDTGYLNTPNSGFGFQYPHSEQDMQE
ncbi:MAG: hypothetical protein IPP51_06995 [Bacteroidetes bacterium]|nr:hypothetical protein [Bacteroidota bacterium]